MALPTPPQQDTDEYYTDELEMNSLLINNLKIQLYLTHLLNIDQQQKKKRGRKARRWVLTVFQTVEWWGCGTDEFLVNWSGEDQYHNDCSHTSHHLASLLIVLRFKPERSV
ncbi:hypothetical protein Pcinc_025801 [Petrolisthes cinctipes]|uniref:Uncharacterized protein n=1 Tax=Petrolisthes cinctipes TaxID=88211 RepID=A0AAE1KCE9_PETCI|nr:hypothetical protein Pcinc_025801 [Petrolisthes cinctipes]